MLADRRYCFPFSITDLASRYLFACEALATTKEAYALSSWLRTAAPTKWNLATANRSASFGGLIDDHAKATLVLRRHVGRR